MSTCHSNTQTHSHIPQNCIPSHIIIRWQKRNNENRNVDADRIFIILNKMKGKKETVKFSWTCSMNEHGPGHCVVCLSTKIRNENIGK